MSKVVDVRSGGGEFVILGKALVLPASTTDGTDLPLDGSVRFNPDSAAVEVYASGGWLPLGGSGGGAHTHQISQIIGLADALAAKSNLIHVHPFSEVDGLQAALNAKANTNHIHGIESIVNLETTLQNQSARIDTKANTGHLHVITNITGLTEALDGKTGIGHQHATTDIAGLQPKLDINKMQPYSLSVAGKPTAAMRQTLCIAQRMDIPKNFVGSIAHVRVWPTTAPYVITIKQNNEQVGALSIDEQGRMTFTSSNIIVLLAGDWMEFSFPATADDTLSDLGITILGERK